MISLNNRTRDKDDIYSWVFTNFFTSIHSHTPVKLIISTKFWKGDDTFLYLCLSCFNYSCIRLTYFVKHIWQWTLFRAFTSLCKMLKPATFYVIWKLSSSRYSNWYQPEIVRTSVTSRFEENQYLIIVDCNVTIRLTNIYVFAHNLS